jgi:leucyl aminopeptidase
VTVGGGAVQIVDLATLTGAIMVALGPAVAGLFCNSDALAEQLATAARAAGEKLWRLPLEDEYVHLSLHLYRQSDVGEAGKLDGAAKHVTGLPSRALKTPGAEHLEVSVLRPRV